MWSDGRVCAHCGYLQSTGLRRVFQCAGLNRCTECRSQFTITTKIPMHGTKLDLRVWAAAIRTVLNSSRGISSMVLARMIGVIRKCAGKIGRAIRGMTRVDFGNYALLSGIFEVNEALSAARRGE